MRSGSRWSSLLLFLAYLANEVVLAGFRGFVVIPFSRVAAKCTIWLFTDATHVLATGACEVRLFCCVLWQLGGQQRFWLPAPLFSVTAAGPAETAMFCYSREDATRPLAIFASC